MSVRLVFMYLLFILTFNFLTEDDFSSQFRNFENFMFLQNFLFAENTIKLMQASYWSKQAHIVD